jgi:hypothetical protein
VLLWGSTMRRRSMLATKTYTFTRDLRDFSRLLEAYTLCAMLPEDDPIFST